MSEGEGGSEQDRYKGPEFSYNPTLKNTGKPQAIPQSEYDQNQAPKITRRGFLKTLGLAAAGALGLGVTYKAAERAFSEPEPGEESYEAQIKKAADEQNALNHKQVIPAEPTKRPTPVAEPVPTPRITQAQEPSPTLPMWERPAVEVTKPPVVIPANQIKKT